MSAQDLVDFSPVYKCLHIYTVLGEREEFEKYYRKQRRQQATLTLQPPSNMHESIDGYRVFFHGIVGFFVCEDHILNTGNGLITRGHLDEVWSNASGRIFSTLQTHSAYCTDAGFMLKIKNLMLLFSNTLQGYGFAVEKLYALLHVRNIISFYIPIICSITSTDRRYFDLQKNGHIWSFFLYKSVKNDHVYPIKVSTNTVYINYRALFTSFLVKCPFKYQNNENQSHD